MTRRRIGALAVMVVFGLHMNAASAGPPRLAEASETDNPAPSRTASPKAKHGGDESHRGGSVDSSHSDRGRDDRDRSDTPRHDPPTGNARDSGPGSGEGL